MYDNGIFVVVFLTLTFCKHRPARNIRQPVIPLTDCVKGCTPRNVVKFALKSDLCQFDSFRPKIKLVNMGGDREVVVIKQLSICTLHTMFVNPIRVKPQNFTTLTRNKLVPRRSM